jgi:outer membrane protein assembly factor BamB
MLRARASVGVLSLVVWMVAGVSSAPAAAGDWPQLGFGPAHNGYQTSERTLSASSIGGLQWAWHRAVGEVTGSPTAVGSLVYVDARSLQTGTSALFALHRFGGKPLWSRPLAGSTAEAAGSTPAVANGLVYAVSDGLATTPARLWAFDARTGQLRWSTTPAGPATSTSEQVVSSPTYADGMVLVSASRSPEDFGIVTSAYDATTGAVRWQTVANGYANIPGVPTVAQGRVWVGTTNGGGLIGLDEATGQLIQDQHVCNGTGFVPAVVVASGLVLFPCEDGGGLRAIDAATGALRWVAFGGDPRMLVARPVVHRGVIYTATQTSFDSGSTARLVAIHLTDGSQIWSTRVHTTGISYSLAMANGLLYMGAGAPTDGSRSRLLVYRASNGQLLRVRGLGAFSGWPQSNPSVSNGRVFLGTNGRGPGPRYGGVYTFRLAP